MELTASNCTCQKLKVLFWCIALALGLLQAWAACHHSTINPDMISYLDIADAYSRWDWSKAINAYWSPLYSWILGVVMFVLRPSPCWELTIVRLVGFGIYVFALACFSLFWFELMRYRRSLLAEFAIDGSENLPEWAWLSLGYTLFVWSSLCLIGIRMATPDMCVAAFVYLAAAVLLRIRLASSKSLMFGLLGVILGFGYLAKAAMFPLAFVFLGVSVFLGGKKSLLLVLFAFLSFSVVAGPFLTAISKAKGRLTFGDTGRLNYSWYVNGTTRWIHWQGEGLGVGTPVHPTRKVFDRPAVYEFGSPVGGTYPPWYDPSYWYQGVEVHFI